MRTNFITKLLARSATIFPNNRRRRTPAARTHRTRLHLEFLEDRIAMSPIASIDLDLLAGKFPVLAQAFHQSVSVDDDQAPAPVTGTVSSGDQNGTATAKVSTTATSLITAPQPADQIIQGTFTVDSHFTATSPGGDGAPLGAAVSGAAFAGWVIHNHQGPTDALFSLTYTTYSENQYMPILDVPNGPFPHAAVSISGNRIDIDPEGTGAITLTVPPGSSIAISDVLNGHGQTIPDAQGNILGFSDQVVSGGTFSWTMTVRKTVVTPELLEWNVEDGGADLEYTVSNAWLRHDNQVALYWSTTPQFANAIGGPVCTLPIKAMNALYSTPVHVPAASLGVPPPQAAYLLAVADPANALGNFSPTSNVVAIPYDPTLDVKAKYEGDPGSGTMGRYFSGTNVLADNTFTVELSDSLAALRPTVQVQLGGQVLQASISQEEPHDYVTDQFDPGSLNPGITPLKTKATVGTSDVAVDSASIQVEPLPEWVKGLVDETTTFDPNGDASRGQGAYIFDGFLPGLSLGGSAFAIRQDVPLVGGQSLQTQVRYELNVVAPLATSTTPEVRAGVEVVVNLGSSISMPVLHLAPTSSAGSAGYQLTVSGGETFDPVTLNGGVVSVALDTGEVPLIQKELYRAYTMVFPFDIPTALELTVTASLTASVHAHALIALDSSNGPELDPAGTFVRVCLTGNLTATQDVGWLAPPWVFNLLKRFVSGNKIPSFYLRDTATVSLTGTAQANFGGPASNPVYSGLLFTGTARFSDRLDLLFELGNIPYFDLLVLDIAKHGPTYEWPMLP